MKPRRPRLAAVPLDELLAWTRKKGQPAYRANQVIEWVCRRFVSDPAMMTNLPGEFRGELAAAFAGSLPILEEKIAGDGTSKFLLELEDGETLESVLIPAADGRVTLCASSQVGCPVGCRFCASGVDGLVRNLDAGEMLEQFLGAARWLGRVPDNLVMMGIGEPLLNFDNLAAFLDILHAPERVGYGARRVTISTSGWLPGIKKLADLPGQWNLAVSLHAPDDQTRAKIIPDKYRFPVAEIAAAVQAFQRGGGRQVTFEYTLLAELNDSPAQARALAALARSCHAKINLIPYNETAAAPEFRRPAEPAIRRFQETLAAGGVNATRRVERGADIAAACGQLRRP